MDDFTLIILGLAVVLGFPGLTIAAFVMVLGARGRLTTLERETQSLRQQLSLLSSRTTVGPQPLATGAPTVAVPDVMPTGVAPVEPDAVEDLPLPATDLFDLPEPLPKSDTLPDVEPMAGPPVPPPLPTAATVDGISAAALPPPPPMATPAPPRRSFEEAIGTRWTVWIGGLALALGGIFLVKYSIDEGLFTPAMRIVLAAVFSAALIALGEYLRRQEPAPADATPNAAPIPAILTAAGTIAAFATIYGAYGLYHLIGDVVAFALLGAVAVGTMLAALLHGPWIATLGIFGAYATPFMVASATPNLVALIAYLLAVTFAAFGVARVRLWHLVALWALALALIWGGFISIAAMATHTNGPEFGIYVIGLIALVAGFLVIGLDDAPEPPLDRSPNIPGLIGLTGCAVLAAMYLELDTYSALSLVVATLVVVTSFGLAWRYPAMVIATAIAGLFTVLGLANWTINLPATLDTGVMVQNFDGIVRIRPNLISEFASFAGVAAAVFFAVGGLGALRATPQADRTGGWFAGSAAFVPAFVLIVAWLRIDGWVPSPLFAAFAIALAVLLGALTTRLITREDTTAPSTAVAIAAIGTIAAISSGLTISLEKGALTIALALMVPAIAWVHAARPIAILRPMAALIGAIVLVRVLIDPRIVGDDLGTTPIFNWLLYGYGVPTVGFAYAARSFRRTTGATAAIDPWIGGLEALTILFAGMLGVLELHHYMNTGNMVAPPTDVAEVGLMTTMGFVAALGLSRLAGQLQSIVYEGASMVISTLTVLAVFTLLTYSNPAFVGYDIGKGLFFNDLLPGFLIPAIVAGVAAHVTRRNLTDIRANGLSVIAVLLSFTYVTLMTRHVYQGENVQMIGAYFSFMPNTGDEETWAYSAVWLVYGIVMLVLGGLTRSALARLIAAAIIVLTVVKVFLIDMSELTGIFRALSFIGLGAVLLLIGFVYQKWLFASRNTGSASPSDAEI